MRLAWCTDIHLDHLTDQGVVGFGHKIVEQNPEGVIISGDISNSKQVIYQLALLEKVVQRPTFFVLGNHDFYGGSIEEVRKNMLEVNNISQYLRYLTAMPYVALTPTTALVGHDGWYDAGFGNWKTSNFGMADWIHIAEFAMVSRGGHAKDKIVEVAQKQAYAAVMHVHSGIKQAVRYHKNVVVTTHVPPFQQSHLHRGVPGDNNALPWFTSKLMGDMLLDASRAFPKVNFTVLAGHTHGKYSGQITENLHVYVGGAEYGSPQIQEFIELP